MLSRSLPSRTLPAHPDLDQLERQAKELLEAFRAGESAAVADVSRHHGGDPTTFALPDAQLVLARAYGFDSWPKLKAYVDGATVAGLADAVRARDLAKVRALLAARPELVHMDMSEHNEHRALHYAVLDRNPEMARVLMAHGADPFKGIWPHRDATGALTLATERGYGEIVTIINEALERRRAAEAARRPNRAADVPNIDLSSPVMARLIPAMTEGHDEATVLSCLEEDPRLIRAHKGDGWTMLHQASLMLFLDAARWLIDHGADVNAYEPCYWTPLELVGRYRKNFTPAKAAAMTELLTSHGARMTAGAALTHGDADWLPARHAEAALTDPPGPYGLVARAVIAGRADMLTLLLDLGFDPDERRRSDDLDDIVSSWGEPLRACAIAGKPELAEILLKRGADPNPSIYAASTPMFEAYQRGRQDVIAVLERYGGFADALVVGHFGLIDRAQQLLTDEAAGRLQPRTASNGRTVAARLLDSGAGGGRPDIVLLALEHLDWPPGDERWHWNLMRPLGTHAEADRDRYVKCFELMVRRAGANAPGPYGRTILHDICADWPRETATAEERVALATIVLDAGARLDRRDDLLKSTPLGWACRWGRLELARLFIERGADPVEADSEPWATPRAWAEKMTHESVLRVLQEYGQSRA